MLYFTYILTVITYIFPVIKEVFRFVSFYLKKVDAGLRTPISL